MIPAEVGLISHITANFNEEQNDQLMRVHLDMIEELREKSHMRNLEYKRRSASFYNKRVSTRSFQVGDRVWRKATDARKPGHEGKLAANWDGPYVIKAVKGEGAYMLEYPSRGAIP